MFPVIKARLIMACAVRVDSCPWLTPIVHQKETRAVVLDFEPAARVLKPCQRFRDFFKRDAELRRERDDSQRIVNVMLSGDIQRCFAKVLSPMIDPERRSKILHEAPCPTEQGRAR